ncbi:hypothetical protein [Nonomuraea maheshkhaliensis]|uniref:hypothetical protein n=1 Tax=Nonomuraea maheshkhaliensis TaxID=419590 RepID=UPI0031F75327
MSLTVLGTTVTGDPAVMVVFHAGDLLQTMEDLRDNPFAGLLTPPGNRPTNLREFGQVVDLR